MDKKKSWLKELRERIGIKQEELAARLQLAGQDYSRSSVSSWENGYHHPPLNDKLFRQALADALEIDTKIMLKKAGFEVSETQHGETAEQAARLIDKMPPDKQDLALRLIEQLAKSG